jgi:ABC-type amino acid transport substrate-binding protein
MDKSMKLILFLALLVGNILAYGNPLTIGVINFAPPFSSAIGNSGHYFGFCIDLMDALCARINESCHYKETQIGQKQLEDLRRGTIDITFLTSPITLTNNTDYLFSLPYIPSTGQFLTSTDSKINSLDELPGKKIGVIQATDLKKTFLSKYTSPENIHEYAKMTDLLSALNSHQVDVILMNASVAKYVINNLQHLKLVGQPIELGMGYGIIALKNKADIINKINKALLQMETDGSYVAIYKKYFGN